MTEVIPLTARLTFPGFLRKIKQTQTAMNTDGRPPPLESYTKMSTPRDGPNPLRPYYIPPSVGLPPDPPASGLGTSNISGRHAPTSTASFGSSARNILSDIDYSDYLAADSPSPPAIIKRLIEQALWKYMSVFLAQPFDVTKTILQVHVGRVSSKGTIKDAPAEDLRRRHDIYEVRAVSMSREIPFTDI